MPRLGPVSPTELAKVAQSGFNRALAIVAERQHGVVTLAQLVALGLSPAAVRARVKSGRLRRLHRGVYAVAGVPLGPHAHLMAAVLACDPGAVLSHQSAAALWGFRGSAATVIDVTVPTRAGRRRQGIRVHRGDRLAKAEVTIVEGVPCTTVARTVVDLAGVLAPPALEYAIHRAQTKRMLRRKEIVEVLARAPTRPGTAAVRRVLGLAVSGEDQVRSDTERRLVRICARAGLSMPRVNAWIALETGDGFEVDFSWPEQMLVVEVDSRTYHGTDRALENDPRRDRQLTLAGWRVARFSYRDVTERADAVAAELWALLELQPHRPR
jgi:very-short-patch-repair endonuclease